jgi:hypothetical protein
VFGDPGGVLNRTTRPVYTTDHRSRRSSSTQTRARTYGRTHSRYELWGGGGTHRYKLVHAHDHRARETNTQRETATLLQCCASVRLQQPARYAVAALPHLTGSQTNPLKHRTRTTTHPSNFCNAARTMTVVIPTNTCICGDDTAALTLATHPHLPQPHLVQFPMTTPYSNSCVHACSTASVQPQQPCLGRLGSEIQRAA